jgi:hypothetical protein
MQVGSLSRSQTDRTRHGATSTATPTIFGRLLNWVRSAIGQHPRSADASNNYSIDLRKRRVVAVRSRDRHDDAGRRSMFGRTDVRVAPVLHCSDAPLFPTGGFIITSDPENALCLAPGRAAPPSYFSSETILERAFVYGDDTPVIDYLRRHPERHHANGVDGLVWLLMKEISCHAFSIVAKFYQSGDQGRIWEERLKWRVQDDDPYDWPPAAYMAIWPGELFGSGAAHEFRQASFEGTLAKPVLDLYVWERSLGTSVGRRSERCAFLRWVAKRLDEFEEYATSCGLFNLTLAPLDDVRQKLAALLAREWKLERLINEDRLRPIKRVLELLAAPSHCAILTLPHSLYSRVQIGHWIGNFFDDDGNGFTGDIRAVGPSVDEGRIEVRVQLRTRHWLENGEALLEPLTFQHSREGDIRSDVAIGKCPVVSDFPSLERRAAYYLLYPKLHALGRHVVNLPDLSGEQLLDVDGLAQRFQEPLPVQQLRALVVHLQQRAGSDAELRALYAAIEEVLLVETAYVGADFNRAEDNPYGFRAAQIDKAFRAFLPYELNTETVRQNASGGTMGPHSDGQSEYDDEIIAD